MNDSADIKTAAARLQSALRSLEDSLGPVMSRVTILEKAAKDAESFQQDRAQLATLLDESTAKEAYFTEREAEFNALAENSAKELDAIISQVQQALSGATSGRAN